jgi:serine/threonine-protein kinase
MEALAPKHRLAGRYVLEEPVAEGGMATVWRAVDDVLARTVAVKVLHRDLAGEGDFAERFRREAVAAARLTHPAIVGVFDTGEDAGLPYLVMEYFDGRTLRDLLDREGPLEPGRAVSLMLPVLSALGFAHACGLVHRDVKPGNILVGADGTVKVTDFGIAKAALPGERDLTTTGTILGTVRYLAPEQVQGSEVDGRSDLYSVGVVLYEALTGRPPFEAKSDLATAMMRLSVDPLPPRAVRPGLPRDLEAVVLRALARRPEDRFPSAEAMQAALERLAGASPDAGAAPSPPVATHRAVPVPTPSRSATFRSWMLVPLALSLLAAGAVAAGLVLGRLEVGGPLGLRPAPEAPSRPPPARPLPVRGAVDVDPQGNDRRENPDDVPLAIDGDRRTGWTTEHYNSASFGNLKDGLGLWLDLGGPVEVTRVSIDTDLSGWAFQLRAGTPEDPSAPLPATDGSRTFVLDRPGRTVIDLRPVRTGGLMVWVTGLGPDGGRFAARINEVRVLGVAR